MTATTIHEVKFSGSNKTGYAAWCSCGHAATCVLANDYEVELWETTHLTWVRFIAARKPERCTHGGYPDHSYCIAEARHLEQMAERPGFAG